MRAVLRRSRELYYSRYYAGTCNEQRDPLRGLALSNTAQLTGPQSDLTGLVIEPQTFHTVRGGLNHHANRQDDITSNNTMQTMIDR